MQHLFLIQCQYILSEPKIEMNVQFDRTRVFIERANSIELPTAAKAEGLEAIFSDDHLENYH